MELLILFAIFNAIKIAFLASWFYIAPVALFIFFYTALIDYKEGLFKQSWDPVCLAINIPSENLRTPFAMEQVFSAFYGILNDRDWIENNWMGEFQEWISCEIVGIEGNVIFIIWTPKKFQNLAESAVYAQYPEAEVYEIENYTDIVPDSLTQEKFPYEIWGTDLDLKKKDCYPLKTYVDYEKMAKTEEAVVDPLAGLVEVLANLRQGEQIWFQIIVQPVKEDWKKEGEKEIKKLMKIPEEKKPGFYDTVVGRGVAEFADFVYKGATQGPFGVPEWDTFGEAQKDERNSLPSHMLYLSPGQREVVEAIERNIAKLGFRSKMRVVTIMHHDNYDKIRFKEFQAKIAGVLAQFGSIDLNSLNFKRRVSAHYVLPEMRKSKRKKEVIKEYKNRSLSDGKQFHYNAEELATLFHIPLNVVKNPQMKQIASRKAQAPPSLPTG